MKSNQIGIARALWLFCVISILFASWSYLTFASRARRFAWAWSIVFLVVAAIGVVQLLIRRMR